jgi:hypothetical protein
VPHSASFRHGPSKRDAKTLYKDREVPSGNDLLSLAVMDMEYPPSRLPCRTRHYGMFMGTIGES